MGQKRDRTRTDSLCILAVLWATDLKCYVFINKMKEYYFVCLCSLAHSFFPSTLASIMLAVIPKLHMPVNCQYKYMQIVHGNIHGQLNLLPFTG